jgi:hypothetical protein
MKRVMPETYTKADDWKKANGYISRSYETCMNCDWAESDSEDYYYCGLMEKEGVIRDPQLVEGFPKDEDGNMVRGSDTCSRFKY